MELDKRLTRVAVIGAAGKMGSGISLLLLQELSWMELTQTRKLGQGEFRIELIDQSEKGLCGLYQYLKVQLKRFAEQKIQKLREFWQEEPSLISNEEMIEAYIDGTMAMTRLSTEYSAAKDAHLVFEAILEEVDAKVSLYRRVEDATITTPLYFTNTSSIPIHILADQANIKGRLVGFHFYNPPAVQKLLELIFCEATEPHIKSIAEQLAERLNKTTVCSHDIAGFIGNGHFIREVLYALEQVHELSKTVSLSKAIAFYDQLTRDLLVRPMGIFQLVDYVGLDVVAHIVKIMSEYLPDATFKVPLIDEFLKQGVRGGQHSDGTQREGFFDYKKGRPDAVYALEFGEYQPLPDNAALLEPFPEGWRPWKEMQKERDPSQHLTRYFLSLSASPTQGAQAACRFLKQSRKISEQLVADGVANSLKDVTIVLKNGFFHVYGPDLPLEKAL